LARCTARSAARSATSARRVSRSTFFFDFLFSDLASTRPWQVSRGSLQLPEKSAGYPAAATAKFASEEAAT